MHGEEKELKGEKQNAALRKIRKEEKQHNGRKENKEEEKTLPEK